MQAPASASGPLDLVLSSLTFMRLDASFVILQAPNRRIDNVITRLTDSVHLLQVHATVSNFANTP
jgi:hypothetical protein